MKRYVVYDSRLKIGHAETKKKAWQLAHKYEYECINQDIPYYPTIKIEKEILERD